MFHRHTQPFAQRGNQEFPKIADSGIEGYKAKPRVCSQINHTVDQTTYRAHSLQEPAEVPAIAFEKRPDEHVRQLGGKAADDFSFLDVHRNCFSSPLCYNCSIQFVQFSNYQRISVIADVLFQNLGYQADARCSCSIIVAGNPMVKSLEDVFTDFQFAAIDLIVHHADEKIICTQSLSNLDPVTSYAKVIETPNDALGNVYEVRVSGIARDGFAGQVKIALMNNRFRHGTLLGEL